MSERKPPGLAWESWVEQQIRAAQEEGLFDALPGHGQPLSGIDDPHDELWWLRAKLRRERVAVPLPPQLQVRKDLDEFRSALAHIADEETVRQLAVNLNHRIREVNRTTVSGPPTTVAPIDVDALLDAWRAARAG
jgi:DnaJ homologue, subfamily C, member 28, conserved domain